MRKKIKSLFVASVKSIVIPLCAIEGDPLHKKVATKQLQEVNISQIRGER